MTLGERIKEIRKDNNMTQKEFAEKISVSRPFISRIEADKEKPSESLMKLISAFFNIELDWIISGTGYKETELVTTIRLLSNNANLPIEGYEKYDFADCSSILIHLLNSPQTKKNSERYYRSNIRSILAILNSFFSKNDVIECEKEDIEAVVTYIQKKIYEAIKAFENENLNEN